MTKLIRMKWRLGLAVVVLLGCLLTQGVYAQGERLVLLTAAEDEVVLGRRVDYLEDVTGQLTVAEVMAMGEDGRFQPVTQDAPNFGFTSSAYWLRIQLRWEGERPSTWWLEISNAALDQIDVYIPDDADNFTRQQAGSTIPYTAATTQHHYPAFHFDLAPSVDQIIYLRIVENAAFIVPMTLLTNAAFINDIQNEQIFLGFTYGILLVMLVYNLFLYWVFLHIPPKRYIPALFSRVCCA